MSTPHPPGGTVTPAGNTTLSDLILDVMHDTISFRDFVIQAKALGYHVSNIWDAQTGRPFIFPLH